MKSIVPSPSGGMNSLPIRRSGIHVSTSAIAAAPITVQRRCSTARTTGSYAARRTRLSGFARSRQMRPRMNSPIVTGTSVTDRRLAAAIAKVFVNASGRKSRPSCPSSANTGRNDTVMISSEKKSAGPTSRADATTTRHRSPALNADASSERAPPVPGTARSRCLCMFSIITIAPSIIAPIAIAIPPSDIMSALTPRMRIAMNASRIPTGSVRIATSAERAWKRKARHTRATIKLSSSSFPLRLAIARSMSVLRSYTGVMTTPGGSPGAISASRAFTRAIVVSAFSPKRITTIPPTASPRPSSSATPRRTAGPTETRPSSATRIGVPRGVAPITTFSMSEMDLR